MFAECPLPAGSPWESAAQEAPRALGQGSLSPGAGTSLLPCSEVAGPKQTLQGGASGRGHRWDLARVPSLARAPGANRTSKISCNPQNQGGNGVTTARGNVPDPHFHSRGCSNTNLVAFGAGRGVNVFWDEGVPPLACPPQLAGPWFCPSCIWDPSSHPWDPQNHSQALVRGVNAASFPRVSSATRVPRAAPGCLFCHRGSPYHLSRPMAPSRPSSLSRAGILGSRAAGCESAHGNLQCPSCPQKSVTPLL